MKDITEEIELIESLEEKLEFDDDNYKYLMYKENNKFWIETNKTLDQDNSKIRFQNIDGVEFTEAATTIDLGMKILSSNLRTTDCRKSKFSVSEFCSLNFQKDKKLKQKLIIPYKKEINIRYDDFFSNYDFMIYVNNRIFSGIRFNINSISLEMYHLDKFFIVESLDEIEYKQFDQICRFALASFGFVTGFVPMDRGYYFGYKDEEIIQYLFSGTFYNTYKSQFSLLTTNPYQFYQNHNLSFSFENGKFTTDERIEELQPKLKPFERENFEKLVNTMLNEEKFSEIIFSMININNLKGFSVFLKAGLYSIVLEMITTIVTSKDKKKDEEDLKDKRKRKELQGKLYEEARKFYEKNEINFKGSIVEKRINGIFNPLNTNKLLLAYELLDIKLNAQEKKNIELRNKFLHGALPFKDKEFEALGAKLFYINLELNYLVSALIFKYMGYKGALKNLAKIYLDYKKLKELDNEDYFKTI
ncbi:hypothetical protein HX037_05135 [Ignatzschineria indica]|uniref:hypothetical protein n=1 Tax=Ignatzschineria indica TaxID=472583 RepID=UPI002575AD47|nr:hypothetical protein [Ignatzschineria indica]MDM1545266.1 hypothetical protein [Ignatzschineria indica]